MIKGDRLIRKFKIAPVLVTPDRNRWDGRKWSQTMEQIFFLVFIPFVVWIFLLTRTRWKQHIYGCQPAFRDASVIMFSTRFWSIFVMCETEGDADPARSFLPISQVKHFEVRKDTQLQSERKTAERNGRLSGVMGEGIDLGGAGKSIGNALHYYIMILNIYHVVP